jgi:transposase InsO family protein
VVGWVVPMETRLAMVVAGSCAAVSVTALCAELEISRQTYYRLRRRYLAEGPAGLTPRSRRPHRCPGAVDPGLELEIIRLRTDEGWPDPPRGAASIADELRRSGLACPAVSTIHRVLQRNGLVTPQPQKRPRASYTRFTYPDPNGCWQIDATRWELAGDGPDGREGWVMDVLDDHSRVVVAAHACPGPTTAAAQAAVHAGGQVWGLPARVLSDNGSCFGGVGRTGDFVDGLAGLGIAAIHARPCHPQTCGKIERFHQTLKRWLRTQPRAASLAELQAQLDWFLEFYNHHRPHRALRGATPAEAWAARSPVGPAEAPIAARRPARVTLTRHTVTRAGVIYLGRRTIIGLGTRLAGTELTAVRYGRRLLLLDDGHPVRALTLTEGQRYYRQPSQPLLEPTPPAEQGAPRTPRAGRRPAPACQPGAAEARSSRGARSAIATGDARQGALEL